MKADLATLALGGLAGLFVGLTLAASQPNTHSVLVGFECPVPGGTVVAIGTQVEEDEGPFAGCSTIERHEAAN